MQSRYSISAVALCGALIAACSDTTPTSPTQSTEKIALAKEGQVKQVQMMDGCDPASFDAVLGEGACARSGGVAFDKFIELVGKHHKMDAWHFAPSVLNVKVGQELLAINSGGEAHTFTEVEAFGGGIVPELNALLGNLVITPECAALEPDDFVPPGGTYSDDVEEAGDELYQCCIHPWMRAIVHAR